MIDPTSWVPVQSVMEHPQYYADSSSLGFPLGTVFLLVAVFSMSGLLSCCYHCKRIRSLRRRADLEAADNPASFKSTLNSNMVRKLLNCLQHFIIPFVILVIIEQWKKLGGLRQFELPFGCDLILYGIKARFISANVGSCLLVITNHLLYF